MSQDTARLPRDPDPAPPPPEAPRPSGMLADVTTGATRAAFGPAGPPPRRLRLPVTPWRRATVVVLGAGAVFGLFVSAIEQLEGLGFGPLPAAVVAAAQTVPLAAVVVSPLVAWRWLTLGLLLGTLATPGRQDFAWPVTSVLLLALVLYVVATTNPRRTVVGVWALTTVGVFLPPVVLSGTPAAVGLSLAGAAGVVLVLGGTVRDRGAFEGRLASAAAQRREDLARQAVLEERAHIARELHDVVAHHMSMIAVQAEAAPLRYPDLSPEVAGTFEVIRDASREALTEMRRVIGVLRTDDDAERSPQPGTDQLGQLVEASRRSGMAVDLVVTGDRRPLAPAVDISAYRVVQEALSNARRHAPGAAVLVEVAYADDRLRIRVADDGARVAGGRG